MKKVLITLFIALLAGHSVSAQDRGMKFGFQVSPGVSWFNPDMNDVENGARGSFGFGAMADIPLLDNIAFSTGIGGHFNGGKLRFPKHAVPVADENSVENAYLNEATYKLRYVKLPLTFKGMTNMIGHMRYFIEFGGSVEFNYLARLDMNNAQPGNPGLETQEDYPIKRMVRTFRTSMIIRAGAEYNMTGSTNIVFGLTFDNGLSNTFNPENTPTYEANSEDLPRKDENGDPIPSDDMKAITNSISVNIGVLF